LERINAQGVIVLPEPPICVTKGNGHLLGRNPALPSQAASRIAYLQPIPNLRPSIVLQEVLLGEEV
jgi:hypothetical protein